jgi:hypothetical protein
MIEHYEATPEQRKIAYKVITRQMARTLIRKGAHLDSDEYVLKTLNQAGFPEPAIDELMADAIYAARVDRAAARYRKARGA